MADTHAGPFLGEDKFLQDHELDLGNQRSPRKLGSNLRGKRMLSSGGSRISERGFSVPPFLALNQHAILILTITGKE